MIAALMPAATAAQVARPAGQQQATGSQQTTGREQQTPPPGGRGAARGANRPGLPQVTANMNQQQLQSWIDTYAVIQADKDLQLTGEQYAPFVARLRKVQDIRRRQQMEKGRLMRELNQLLQSSEGSDEAILAHVRSLDDLSQKGAAELKQAYQELDAGLTPRQRGRLRMFEERLERLKIDLLAKINSNPTANPNPGRGGGGGAK